MSNDLINEFEAAKRLGISVLTLRVWRCNKRYSLKYIKVGKCVRYRPEDIEDFIENCESSGVLESP